MARSGRRRRYTTGKKSNKKFIQNILSLPPDTAKSILDRWTGLKDPTDYWASVKEKRKKYWEGVKEKRQVKSDYYKALKDARKYGSNFTLKLKDGDVDDNTLNEIADYLGLARGTWTKPVLLKRVNELLEGSWTMQYKSNKNVSQFRSELKDTGFTSNDDPDRVRNRYQRLIVEKQEPIPSDIDPMQLSEKSLALMSRAKANMKDWKKTFIGPYVQRVADLKTRYGVRNGNRYFSFGNYLSIMSSKDAQDYYRRFSANETGQSWAHKNIMLGNMLADVNSLNQLNYVAAWFSHGFKDYINSTTDNYEGYIRAFIDTANFLQTKGITLNLIAKNLNINSVTQLVRTLQRQESNSIFNALFGWTQEKDKDNLLSLFGLYRPEIDSSLRDEFTKTATRNLPQLEVTPMITGP